MTARGSAAPSAGFQIKLRRVESDHIALAAAGSLRWISDQVEADRGIHQDLPRTGAPSAGFQIKLRRGFSRRLFHRARGSLRWISDQVEAGLMRLDPRLYVTLPPLDFRSS